jgi:hypothetical protein
MNFIAPYGFLDRSNESHALWNYYVSARLAYETCTIDVIQFEDEKTPETNLRQLFESIAFMYNVKPDEMAKCWSMIDMQCRAIDCPPLPDEERFRFNRKTALIL